MINKKITDFSLPGDSSLRLEFLFKDKRVDSIARMNMTIRGLRHWIAWGIITTKGREGTVEPTENLLNDWTHDHSPLEGFSASVWKHQPSNPDTVLIDGKFEQHNLASSPPFVHPDSSGFLLDHSDQAQHLRDTFNPIENMVDSIFENDHQKKLRPIQ